MANMSYCRFQNTLQDLQDCLYHLNDHIEEEKELSEAESKARKKLIVTCQDIIEEMITE